MEILNHVFAVSDVLWRISSVIFTIMVVVFVHEMGHYLVGRLCGIRASVFSIGFGPPMLSYTDKYGTRWRLSWIFLGGYVRFVGDEDETDVSSSKASLLVRGSFSCARAWKRAVTVFAGPLFNVLFGIIVLAFFFFYSGSMTVEPVVGSLVKDSPASQAGLLLGDRFIEINGQKVKSFEDLAIYVASHGENSIEFTMERVGRIFKTVIVPKVTEQDDGFGNKIQFFMIGVGAPIDPENSVRLNQAYVKKVYYSAGEAVREALRRTTFIVTQTIFFIGRLMSGGGDFCQLSGPSKVATVAWKISETGFISLLNFSAFLSVNIALINLFPILPLDGGRLLFYTIEAVIGRSVPAKIQEVLFRVGIFTVFTFVVFVFFNDYFCWLS
ncbi:RIP metalloprotease RseP [Bartonella ancashensis]|uniref:Zinc metalloprotease n=1 Tax=Bartonella ancashensis TaxID=1318743 RepID=A0A0M4LJB8_9HYPH|nr:RIP metalloprotease RseP [Bartonella ancashensis]ALE03893.1 Membrane-associated zinc metalloprotease [Bartonella ancashensis]